MKRPRGFPWAAPTWPKSAGPPPVEPRLGVDYDGAWSRKYPARIARAAVLDNLTRPAIHAIASPTITGLERLAPLRPPVIFAANHASHIDTPLLLVSLPQRFRHHTVVGAASDHFFDRRWKAALWSGSVGAIPIERQRVSRRSAELAARLLEERWNLVIFPEGGRTPDGWAQAFKGGAAYLSKRTSAPLVPVHIAGTRPILRKGGRRLRASSTHVSFGKPLLPSEQVDARHLAAQLESALATLADELDSDWWTAMHRAAEATTPSLQGPDASPWRRAWALGDGPGRTAPAWPREARGGRRFLRG